MLADEIGALDLEIKALEARMAAARAELKARNVEKAEGRRFAVTVSEALRSSLDSKGIREAMGEAWCNLHSKIAVVTTVRVKAIA
jgi:hypothetical protein